MSRRGLVQVGLTLVALAVVLPIGIAARAEDARTSQQFLQELRDKGFHDLALEFIDRLRADPGLPADQKALLEYQEGRTEIDEASKTGDLVRRRELLEQARTKLEAFTKAQPNHPLAREALVQIARMLVERGHLALLQADDVQEAGPKATKQAEARASFTQAREAFGRAVDQLNAAYKGFSGFIAKGDPRLEERAKVYSALLDAMLQKAVSDYELARSYPAGSKERTDHLNGALAQFEDLYKNY